MALEPIDIVGTVPMFGDLEVAAKEFEHKVSLAGRYGSDAPTCVTRIYIVEPTPMTCRTFVFKAWIAIHVTLLKWQPPFIETKASIDTLSTHPALTIGEIGDRDPPGFPHCSLNGAIEEIWVLVPAAF